MPKRIFAVTTLVITILLGAVTTMRFSQARQLERTLFTCLNNTLLCEPDTDQQPETSNLSEGAAIASAHVYRFLSHPDRYPDIRPVVFTGTTRENFTSPSSILNGGNALSGFQPLRCPYDPCGLYETRDSIILVSDNESVFPVIQHWKIIPDQLLWQGVRLQLKGTETQQIVTVPDGSEAVASASILPLFGNEVVRKTPGGLEASEMADNVDILSLIENASLHTDNVLWEKSLTYVVECSFAGCVKTYDAATD